MSTNQSGWIEETGRRNGRAASWVPFITYNYCTWLAGSPVLWVGCIVFGDGDCTWLAGSPVLWVGFIGYGDGNDRRESSLVSNLHSLFYVHTEPLWMHDNENQHWMSVDSTISRTLNLVAPVMVGVTQGCSGGPVSHTYKNKPVINFLCFR